MLFYTRTKRAAMTEKNVAVTPTAPDASACALQVVLPAAHSPQKVVRTSVSTPVGLGIITVVERALIK